MAADCKISWSRAASEREAKLLSACETSVTKEAQLPTCILEDVLGLLGLCFKYALLFFVQP